MGEIALRKRVARLVFGFVLMDVGAILAWKSHDLGIGLTGSRIVAGVGAMIAAYGFMTLLGSGALAILTALGGVGFFSWSLWAVLTGGGPADVARLGLWCGPLLAIIGFVFLSPYVRSKAAKKSR